MSQQAGIGAWIGDSGASAHMILSSTSTTNYRTCERPMHDCDGSGLSTADLGDVAVVLRPAARVSIPMKLFKVAHVLKICYNLFPLTAFRKRGHGFTGSHGVIVVS